MKSLAQIKAEYQSTGMEELAEWIAHNEEDERTGVRRLIESARKRMTALEKEKQRIETLRMYEEQYSDCDYICGIDEVGRGPLQDRS